MIEQEVLGRKGLNIDFSAVIVRKVMEKKCVRVEAIAVREMSITTVGQIIKRDGQTSDAIDDATLVIKCRYRNRKRKVKNMITQQVMKEITAEEKQN